MSNNNKMHKMSKRKNPKKKQKMSKQKNNLNIKTIHDSLSFIIDIEDTLKKINHIKSFISVTQAATIKKEDNLDYRLCDLFIPILEKYLKQFEYIFIQTKILKTLELDFSKNISHIK